MKIGIIGTRGIPNNYGGFEQLAQHLSLGLKARGHEVYVYNSHRHPYKSDNWNGIHLIAKRDPEHLLGTVGQFVYDFNCILDCRRHRFDVILNLGYTSSSVWMWLFPSSTRVLTNMDGLEWKRSKYNGAVKKFLRYAESLAVKGSEVLIADSVAIQQYLKREYMVESTFIAYGADIFDEPDLTLLDDFGLKPYGYNLLIARMEPENNLRMILDGIAKSPSEMPMLVVGNHKNKYGNYLVSRYAGNKKIVFTGPIYEPRTVNNLRYFSHLYFHGHSVGGTNPSLLEAMGCGCSVAAHDNEFNRSVLGTNAYYFTSPAEIEALLTRHNEILNGKEQMKTENVRKIRELYSWQRIVSQYEEVMLK